MDALTLIAVIFPASTRRFPVLYIFGKEAIDVDDCMASFKSTFPDKLSHAIIMYDVRYSHVIGEFKPQVFSNTFLVLNIISEYLYEKLMKDYVNIVMATLVIPGKQKGSHRKDEHCNINGVKCGQSEDNKENEATREPEAVVTSLPQERSDKTLRECKLGRFYTLSAPIKDYSIFYIGGESRTLSNLIISYQFCQVQLMCVCLQEPLKPFFLAVLLLQSSHKEAQKGISSCEQDTG